VRGSDKKKELNVRYIATKIMGFFPQICMGGITYTGLWVLGTYMLLNVMYNGSDKVYVKTSSTKLCFIFNIVHGHGHAG
jgi:hypothetical protein